MTFTIYQAGALFGAIIGHETIGVDSNGGEVTRCVAPEAMTALCVLLGNEMPSVGDMYGKTPLQVMRTKALCNLLRAACDAIDPIETEPQKVSEQPIYIVTECSHEGGRRPYIDLDKVKFQRVVRVTDGHQIHAYEPITVEITGADLWTRFGSGGVEPACGTAGRAGMKTFVCPGCGKVASVSYGHSIICSCGTRSAAEISNLIAETAEVAAFKRAADAYVRRSTVSTETADAAMVALGIHDAEGRLTEEYRS